MGVLMLLFFFFFEEWDFDSCGHERKSVGYPLGYATPMCTDNVCPYAHIVYRAAQPAFHVQRIQVSAPYNRVI